MTDDGVVQREGREEYIVLGGERHRVTGPSYEYWRVFSSWYVQVPYRHVTFGWPQLWKARLVKITAPAE